jgi:hypothetical protein
MPLNLSVRRASTILGGLALVAGAIASTSPAALASTAKPNAAAALCKTDGEEVLGSGGDQLWYSPTCRTAWAVSVDGIIGSTLYVYNEDTGAEESTTITSESRTVTAAVNDAGTESQACEAGVITPVGGNPHPYKYCTGFF